MTIFITRTRGPFWSSRPSGALFWSTLSTKLLATLAAVYGVFMVRISWDWALAVWGYSLFWLFISDSLKRGTYDLLDGVAMTRDKRAA